MWRCECSIPYNRENHAIHMFSAHRTMSLNRHSPRQSISLWLIISFQENCFLSNILLSKWYISGKHRSLLYGIAGRDHRNLYRSYRDHCHQHYLRICSLVEMASAIASMMEEETSEGSIEKTELVITSAASEDSKIQPFMVALCWQIGMVVCV